MNVDDVNNWLKSKDEHIANILDWIKVLGNLNIKVVDSEQDVELEEEISQIIRRLTSEVGIRIVSILVDPED